MGPPTAQPGNGYPQPQQVPPYGQPYPGSRYGQPRYVAPPKPGIIPLRPLMFGEILDGSFQAIRRNPQAMLGAALLAQSLSAIVAAVVTAMTAVSSGSIEDWVDSASPADLAAMGFGFFGALTAAGILTMFLSAVLQGAMVVPVARSILNRRTGFRRMWSLSKSRAGALIGLAALLMAAALLAFLLLAGAAVALAAGTDRSSGLLFLIPLIPAFFAVFVWIAIKVMVAPAAVVIEELGPVAALRRSWQLTRSNWWRILGITLVVSILVGVISQVVMIPVSLLTGFLTSVASPNGGSGPDAGAAVAVGVATAVLGGVVGALGYAFQTCVMALLYMDLRMRKDGLDITLLRLLESGADPDGVPGRNTGPGPAQGHAGGAWPDVR
ncbi:Membrane domain of glycerophosphoryl diester phosphodiesterase [Pseudarthrobacter enclensis]|nr:Membrane domain of glycerophosphoryl diester phosphodiesterase [Pseudarthrobacter enclensis]